MPVTEQKKAYLKARYQRKRDAIRAYQKDRYWSDPVAGRAAVKRSADKYAIVRKVARVLGVSNAEARAQLGENV